MTINWSAIDNRAILGRLLRLPLRALPNGMKMTIRRGPAKGMKWVVGSSNHGCWLGTFELDKQLGLEQFVKPGMVVYDVGAQAGFYTLFFSRLVQEMGKVYAFEPFAENTRSLIRHISINGVRNAMVVQMALADRNAIATFTVNHEKHQNALAEGYDTPLLVSTMSID